MAPYTFYCVRWATQKRDILRVCVQKWPIGGGIHIAIFVCVHPISNGPSFIFFLWFFLNIINPVSKSKISIFVCKKIVSGKRQQKL